jgi:hypothetical protein
MRRLGVLGSGGTFLDGASTIGGLCFRQFVDVGISFFCIFSLLSFGLIVLFALAPAVIRLVDILIQRGESLYRGGGIGHGYP